MRLAASLVGPIVLCALVAGCGGPEGPPPGTTPMKELLAQGKAPLELVSLQRQMNPVMKTWKLELRNVSDKPVKMVKWTMVFTGEDGKVLAEDGKVSGGYADIQEIGPGESIEGIQGAPEKAAGARLVLEQVVYETLPPGAEDNESMKSMKINMVWKNPRHDQEVAGS